MVSSQLCGKLLWEEPIIQLPLVTRRIGMLNRMQIKQEVEDFLRAIIPSEKLVADPELRELIDYPRMVGWMGPGRHIMTYPIVSEANATPRCF